MVDQAYFALAGSGAGEGMVLMGANLSYGTREGSTQRILLNVLQELPASVAGARRFGQAGPQLRRRKTIVTAQGFGNSKIDE